MNWPIDYDIMGVDTRPKYSRVRCPECNALSRRIDIVTRRCRNGHDFPDPNRRIIIENIDLTPVDPWELLYQWRKKGKR